MTTTTVTSAAVLSFAGLLIAVVMSFAGLLSFGFLAAGEDSFSLSVSLDLAAWQSTQRL